MAYAELQTTSNFSFLRGGSHPEELVAQAAALGYSAIAITDRNSVAGIVRGHVAAKKQGIRFIPACRLDVLDGPSLLAYPTHKAAYGRLCTLLTLGNSRTEKGQCLLNKSDVYAYQNGIKFIIVPPNTLTATFELDSSFKQQVMEYRKAFGNAVYLGATCTYRGDDSKRLFRLQQLAAHTGMPLVAIGDVHYHEPERRELQDILTCIREKGTIHDAGFRLHQNAERHLKPLREIQHLFRRYPEAVSCTQEIANACTFSLDDLRYVYPEELTTGNRTPQEELERLVWEGAQRQFSGKTPQSIQETIAMELAFIKRKGYASYFLTVHDYVRYAREQGILCQGRGSAANSVVCFCLGITSVNPATTRVLFARFMSDARDEPPDIDVDFEHERREEVIQYIYNKYGRHRAAIVATVTQQRSKGALRDVGKAMGLSIDAIDRLSGIMGGYWDTLIDEQRLADQGFNPADPHLQKTLALTQQLIGFPRQLGQHTGGFVISQGNLHELCPVLNARMANRTCLEWNKDDLEALGFLKVDVLGLGMLTCIRKAFDLIKTHYKKELTLASIPQDEPAVYDMVSHADTLGVFQIESRAQMSMLPRLRPNCFYDLIIEVAIVRPGPIQGDMVHPYLRRRNGEEPIDYPSAEIKDILQRTKGVPLFQEQAMEIAIVAAGFSPNEADELRRSMATFKAKGEVSRFHEKMVSGMVAKGYSADFANRVFNQLKGFGSYGFPESHAASFALLVYISAWIKHFYPEVFAAALLNSQPMGYYQPAQLIADARKHGVVVLPIDVNHSHWDHTLEGGPGKPHALRLGFRQVKGLGEADITTLIVKRANGYRNINALWNAGIQQATLERLADADAFGSLAINRRQALWQITALQGQPTALFGTPLPTITTAFQFELPLMTPGEQVIQDYASTSLSLKAHPVSFFRAHLTSLHITPAGRLGTLKDGMAVKVCGMITVRQRPGTAKGVLFVTIEDETGFANLVMWGKVFETYRKEILQSRLLMATGTLQIEGEVIHVVVKQCFNLNHLLYSLSRTDHKKSPKQLFHKGRNFK